MGCIIANTVAHVGVLTICRSRFDHISRIQILDCHLYAVPFLGIFCQILLHKQSQIYWFLKRVLLLFSSKLLGSHNRHIFFHKAQIGSFCNHNDTVTFGFGPRNN